MTTDTQQEDNVATLESISNQVREEATNFANTVGRLAGLMQPIIGDFAAKELTNDLGHVTNVDLFALNVALRNIGNAFAAYAFSSQDRPFSDFKDAVNAADQMASGMLDESGYDKITAISKMGLGEDQIKAELAKAAVEHAVAETTAAQ